jgi:hypothetical protein
MPRLGAPHPTNTTSACPTLAAAIVRTFIVGVADDDDTSEGNDLVEAVVVLRRSNADDVERIDEANIIVFKVVLESPNNLTTV